MVVVRQIRQNPHKGRRSGAKGQDKTRRGEDLQAGAKNKTG